MNSEVKMKRDILSLREHFVAKGLDESCLSLTNAIFSNDRCASIDSAGAYECQVACQNEEFMHRL